MSIANNDWAADVLHFWFDEMGPSRWFNSDAGVDETITRRFLPLWRTLREDIPAQALLQPKIALAAIIVLDQFPRNMFRGKADAFATDSLALALARNAVASGFDAATPEDRRSFFHMPFMHSESLADQQRCVELFAGNEKQLRHAIEHRDIIAQFGRFPHRNQALGRQNTAEELAFLTKHQGFGQ